MDWRSHGVAVCIRLFFWMYTHRTWEDALITVLHSENAASGLGLTHVRVGEPRIHGFTSPLSVLVPMAGDLIHVGLGLTLIKLVSALISAFSVVFGALVAHLLRLSKPFVVLVAGYLAFEHHQILWGMAGMETEIVVAIILFSIWRLLRPAPVPTGIALGLCTYARTDLAIWVLIALLYLFHEAVRTKSYKPLAMTAAITALLYLPWLLLTTLYYGSPIPNTILAKSAGYPLWIRDHHGIWAFIGAAKHVFFEILAPLGPTFASNGTGFLRFPGAKSCEALMIVFLVAGLISASVKHDLPAILIFSFVAAYSAYYTFLVPYVFGWYCVPLAAITVIACAYGMNTFFTLFPPRWRLPAATTLTALLLAPFAVVLPQTFRGERNIQVYVEDGVRKQIGLYFHDVAGADDTIGCEPLGYIAYYSRRSVYDYPGLCSRRVMQFLRDHPAERSLDRMLAHFRPTYIVLRTLESKAYFGQPRNAWMLNDYTQIRHFQVSPDKISLLFHPEKNIDLDFIILKRNL